MKTKMINAEKIAKHILEHGTKSIIIHTLPQSSFWLICQKTPQSYPNWRIILCDPSKTTWRIISNNVTNNQHLSLIQKLIKAKTFSKINKSQ